MGALSAGRVLTMLGLAAGRVLVTAGLTVGGAGAAADGFFSLLGLVFATLGILALAWWVSRWVGLHGGIPASRQGGEQFRVLGQLYLGRNERLVLVRFQDCCLLLGVTEHSITLLRELDDGESASWLAEAKGPPGFADILGGILKSGEGVVEKKNGIPQNGKAASRERRNGEAASRERRNGEAASRRTGTAREGNEGE